MPGSPSVVGRLAILTLMLVACQTEGPGGSGTGPSFAAGNPTGDPVVTATDPTSAPQDTTLDLRVLGSGYDRGSTVELLLGGQSVGTIRTNSTRYVKSTELVANVTISAAAVVTTYDVAVTTSQGRKGIGTEMFAVKEKRFTDPISLVVTILDAGTRIRSDGLGNYIDGEQTVLAQIDANGNFRLNADPTAVGGRTLTLDFGAQATGVPYSVAAAGLLGFQVLTQQNTTPAPGRINNLPIGVPTCYPVSLGFRTPTLHHRALYHSGAENNSGTQSVLRHGDQDRCGCMDTDLGWGMPGHSELGGGIWSGPLVEEGRAIGLPRLLGPAGVDRFSAQVAVNRRAVRGERGASWLPALPFGRNRGGVSRSISHTLTRSTDAPVRWICRPAAGCVRG